MEPRNRNLSTGQLRVLTVCTGNICRSPMAEAILRAAVGEAGMGDLVVVDSAGTHAYHVGEGADPRARQALAEAGYDLDHRARKLDPDWLSQRELILAMDSGHREHLRLLADARRLGWEHIALIRDFDPASAPGSDVADPYYGSIARFRAVRSELERAAVGVVAHLRDRLAHPHS